MRSNGGRLLSESFFSEIATAMGPPPVIPEYQDLMPLDAQHAVLRFQSNEPSMRRPEASDQEPLFKQSVPLKCEGNIAGAGRVKQTTPTWFQSASRPGRGHRDCKAQRAQQSLDRTPDSIEDSV